MPSRRTRRSVLAAAGLTTLAGCTSFLRDDDDRSPGGSATGDGFSDREFGSEATASMVRYDAANAGAAAVSTGPSGSPTERWASERTLGSPTRPTAVGGTVFANAVNGLSGFTADGERRWAYDPNGSELNPAPVAVVRDRLYATRSNAVFALDAKTGAERWVAEPPVETNRLTAPAVVDDTVYVVGQHPERAPTLWALATLDGSVRWRVALGGESAGPPVVADGRAYCVTTNGGLYVVATTEEAVAWEQALEPAVGPPAATADGVFVGTRAGVVCYDADGAERWRAPDSTALDSPQDGPVLDDETVYAGGPDGEALVALAVDTGEERWRVSLSGEPRSPVVTDDAVYVQDSTGEIAAVSRTDGAVDWSTRLALRSMTGITAAADGLFVGADDRLLRYD
jgi:outer membrane protein assembly factor BamB